MTLALVPALVAVPDEGATMARESKHPHVKTKTAGICKRGNRYRYTYRVRGVQRWGSAATYDEARRLERQAEAGDTERPQEAGRTQLVVLPGEVVNAADRRAAVEG